MKLKLPEKPTIGFTVEFWIASGSNGIEHTKLTWDKKSGVNGWYTIHRLGSVPFCYASTWSSVKDICKYEKVRATELEALRDLLEQAQYVCKGLKQELKEAELRVEEIENQINQKYDA